MLFPQTNATRWTLSLDGLWTFRAQGAKDHAAAAGWHLGFPSEKLVGVPACFNEQFLDYDTYNHMGVVWYAREFTVPDAWRSRRLVLHFAAVNYHAEVFLNGDRLGEHETGFTPFAFPINASLRPGPNLLVVRVDCALSPTTVPQGGFDRAAIPGLTSPFRPSVNFDFFPYSGIHRPVTLLATDEHCLEAVFIDTHLEGEGARLRVRGEVNGSPERVRLRVAGTAALVEAAVTDGRFEASLALPAARPWSPEDPHLYHLDVELLKGDAVRDVYHQSFGVRTVKVEGDRLLLNGRPIYLRGFGRHEELPVLGRTVSHAANVRDLALMRWVGANSYRTSHYPFSDEQLDLADRGGLLVISEAPAVSMIPTHASAHTLDTHCRVMRELIRRDYNHPSVILWCVANEPHSDTPECLPYLEKVFACSRAEDSTRPHIYVSCRFPADRCHHLSDIACFNTYPGWYGGGDKLENTQAYFRHVLDEVRAITGKPVFLSEIGGDAMVGLHSLPSSLWTEEYQADLIAANLAVLHEKDYVIGEHLWCFADFHTPQNHFRAHGSRKGLFTRDRQPKHAAHMLRRLWLARTR